MLLRLYSLFGAALVACVSAVAQATVTARIDLQSVERAHNAQRSAVLWLEPLNGNVQNRVWPSHPPFRLLQKNRTFSPHLLVVPVGASVAFPNADPFFHNVFSLFEGSRFDLGLYEAGSTREVRFSRKGVSYIFCNIHPEMGAIVLSLDTPLWAVLTNTDTLVVQNVPEGTYEASLWMEGQDAATLTAWRHLLNVPSKGVIDAGVFRASPSKLEQHTDKFGQPYRTEERTY